MIFRAATLVFLVYAIGFIQTSCSKSTVKLESNDSLVKKYYIEGIGGLRAQKDGKYINDDTARFHQFSLEVSLICVQIDADPHSSSEKYYEKIKYEFVNDIPSFDIYCDKDYNSKLPAGSCMNDYLIIEKPQNMPVFSQDGIPYPFDHAYFELLFTEAPDAEGVQSFALVYTDKDGNSIKRTTWENYIIP